MAQPRSIYFIKERMSWHDAAITKSHWYNDSAGFQTKFLSAIEQRRKVRTFCKFLIQLSVVKLQMSGWYFIFHVVGLCIFTLLSTLLSTLRFTLPLSKVWGCMCRLFLYPQDTLAAISCCGLDFARCHAEDIIYCRYSSWWKNIWGTDTYINIFLYLCTAHLKLEGVSGLGLSWYRTELCVFYITSLSRFFIFSLSVFSSLS